MVGALAGCAPKVDSLRALAWQDAQSHTLLAFDDDVAAVGRPPHGERAAPLGSRGAPDGFAAFGPDHAARRMWFLGGVGI